MTDYRLWILISVIASGPGCLEERPEPELETPLETSERSVVYGEDDRLDVYAHPDEAWRTLTERSIVAMVPVDDLDVSDPADVRILSDENLGERLGLCEDQRFRDQPDVSDCSATLIDDDLVLTAGHCMGSQRRCESLRYVFGAYFDAEGQLSTITTDDVYSCQRLVQTIPDGDLDHAIVQLDRPVTGARGPAPVKLLDEPMATGSAVTLIGFPSGLPAKIANNGAVVDPREDDLDFFEATVDAFGGNSGSGVFDESGALVGILVRGERDYRDRGGCTVVNELEDERSVEEGAEDITYVARAIERLCAGGFDSPRLCGGEDRGWCLPCADDGECQEGWRCRQWEDAPEISFCAAPCAEDADCRADHTCNLEVGACEPIRRGTCRDGQPWEVDACGRDLLQSATCGDNELCNGGTCTERGVGDTCATAEVIEAVNQTLVGDLRAGYSNNRRGSCGGDGPERIYTFTLEQPRTLTATATGFDTVLHLRRACDEGRSQITCDDDSEPPGDRGSRITADLEPGLYTLMVDAYNNDVGEYTLELDFGVQCPDTCNIGDAVCDGEAGVRACIPDEDGCPQITDVIPCPEGQICTAGECYAPGLGDRCSEATAIDATDQTLSGDLRQGYRNDHLGSCGGEGIDRVYTFTTEQRTRFEAVTSGYDTVLYLRDACDGQSEVACNDDIDDDNRGSRLANVLEPGTWFIFVDSYGDTDDAYSLSLRFTPLCEEECPLGQSVCTDEGVQTCLEDAAGCARWIGPETCPEGEVCREGRCEEACVDECDVASARTCVSDQSYQLCGVGPEGCLVLDPPRDCPEGTLCVEGGLCAAPEEDDEDDEVEGKGEDDAPPTANVAGTRSEGGCATSPGQPRRGTTPTLLLLMGLLLVSGARRRADRS